ncbi:MAG: hypothetical protein OXT49_07035, partial [Gammaproteobacteria bacterium]|nr:hypothetical protein [Gammaproteobacteria bacterium]
MFQAKKANGVDWAVWLVAGVLLIAPLAAPRGAEEVRYAVWLILLFLLGVGIFSARKVRLDFNPMGAALLCCVITAIVQLVPMQREWLAVFSPYALDVHEAKGWWTGWGWISLDPTATWRFLHACSILLVVCWWRAAFAKSSRALRILEYAIIVSAVIQSLIGVLTVFGASDLSGNLASSYFYQGNATGSFVNRSIFGLYLNIALVACLRIIFFSSFRPSFYALLAIRLAMMVLVIGITMSHSRAAGLGFVVVMLVTVVALIARKRNQSTKSVVSLVFVLATIILVDVLL